MSSWWKATRRRAKQKFLETTGASDSVVDEEWNAIWDDFEKDIKAMKMLEKRLAAMKPIHHKWTKALHSEMEGFKDYFSSRDCPDDLRKSSNSAFEATDKLKRAVWPNIDEAYSRGVLEPLRQIFDVEIPNIKENAKNRDNILTDVNSYRRKLQKLLSNEKADPERKQVVKAKLDKAVASFEALDLQLKTHLKKFHAERFERLRGFAQLAMFCQLDVFTRAASMLAISTDHLPHNARDAALQTLGHMHSTKGVRPTSGSSFTFDNDKKSFTGGIHSRTQSAVSTTSDAPPTPSVDAVNMLEKDREQDDNDEEDQDQELPLDLMNSIISPTAKITSVDGDGSKDKEDGEESKEKCNEYVIADFDFTSDDAGDLPFFKGDRIGVLEKGGGWWKGVDREGKTGMFPANYAHAE